MSIVSKLADFVVRGVHFDSLYLAGEMTPGKIQCSLQPSRLGPFKRHHTQTGAMFRRPATKRQTNKQTHKHRKSLRPKCTRLEISERGFLVIFVGFRSKTYISVKFIITDE
jgi:hypothetical protein